MALVTLFKLQSCGRASRNVDGDGGLNPSLLSHRLSFCRITSSPLP